MMWDWHGYGGWWFVVMPLGMLVFWGVVAWVIVMLARTNKRDRSPRPSDDAQHILEARYARGDIDTDEYHHRSDDLRATSSRTG